MSHANLKGQRRAYVTRVNRPDAHMLIVLPTCYKSNSVLCTCNTHKVWHSLHHGADFLCDHGYRGRGNKTMPCQRLKPSLMRPRTNVPLQTIHGNNVKAGPVEYKLLQRERMCAGKPFPTIWHNLCRLLLSRPHYRLRHPHAERTHSRPCSSSMACMLYRSCAPPYERSPVGGP